MFENILGQKRVKNILARQIKSGKIPHAYIFMGQNGVGKRRTAVEFAKILNCSSNDISQGYSGACGVCSNCEKISKNIHSDVHFIDFEKQAELNDEEIDKQKNLKIDTIRYMLKEVSKKTVESKWKFFIVDPAEKMTVEAANSLLKTLEEPPENTVIILIATHKETIPRTIVSRSQTLFFSPLEQNEIATHLMLNMSLSTSKASEIAALSDGSLENAKNLLNESENEGVSLWLKLTNNKLYISDILELSRKIPRDEALNYIDAMTAEAKKEFRLFPKNGTEALELLNRSKSLITRNVNTQTVMDNLLIDLYDKQQS